MLIPDPHALGALVRTRRTQLGMSQTQLAQKVGTTRQWLSRFEQSSNDVSVSIIFAILKELHLELTVTGLEEGLATQDLGAAHSPPGAVQVPLPHVGPPVAPVNPETETDRFALLRSRDALTGLRLPAPKTPPSQPAQASVIAPASSIAPRSNTTQPNNIAQTTAPAPSGQPTLPPLEGAAKPVTGQEKRATPGPAEEVISRRMDLDVARIKKSSLFKR